MSITIGKKFLLLVFIGVSLNSFSQGQQNKLDSSSVFDLSLEELMNLKSTGEYPSELESLISSLLDVSSAKPLTATSSPNIVSYITDEEIQRSGARDIIDVLRLVPGFDFGLDVQNALGLGIRGNWASEGKVLLLLDGQEMNEIMYSSIQFGNRFPVDQIRKIEIIRGPGSSVYGGYAEYGVINIITHSGKELNGAAVSGLYSTSADTYSHRNGYLSLGFNKNDLDVAVHGFMGQGQRSDRMYSDGYENEVSMIGNSRLNPSMLNVGVTYKTLSFRSIYENYRSESHSPFGEILATAYPNNFRNYLAELKYKFNLHSQLSVTPKINYKVQRPWNFQEGLAEEDTANFFLYDKIAQRYRAGLILNWNVSSRWDLTSGGEFFYDHAITRSEGDVFVNEKTAMDFTNYAAFFQLTGSMKPFNVVVGARYDYNNAFGSAFVPRIGITKKYKRLNGKILYAQSFRAPAIENINLAYDGNITPEKSDNFECELGYQLNSFLYLNASAFDITTTNPIVYFVDSLDQEGYSNMRRSGTRGLELSLKAKTTQLYADINYSYYTTASKTQVDDYSVADKPTTLLAFPAHKVAGNIQFTIRKKLSLAVSGVWLGERYGYGAESDSTGALILEKIAPSLWLNTFVQYTVLPGLTVGIGSHNMLDANMPFIQPYNGGHAPIPSFSRTYLLKVAYKFKGAKSKV